MSCVLIYSFVEQIFTENILCLGPWYRGAGKKAGRVDETSLWLVDDTVPGGEQTSENGS